LQFARLQKREISLSILGRLLPDALCFGGRKPGLERVGDFAREVALNRENIITFRSLTRESAVRMSS